MQWHYHKARFDGPPGMGAGTPCAEASRPLRRWPIYLLLGMLTALVLLPVLREMAVTFAPFISPLIAEAPHIQLLLADSILSTVLMVGVRIRVMTSLR